MRILEQFSRQETLSAVHRDRSSHNERDIVVAVADAAGGRKIFITFRNPVNMQMENANRVLLAPTTKAIVLLTFRPSRFLFFE